eukprot:8784356-Prorocentrum_lima.AAC.1
MLSRNTAARRERVGGATRDTAAELALKTARLKMASRNLNFRSLALFPAARSGICPSSGSGGPSRYWAPMLRLPCGDTRDSSAARRRASLNRTLTSPRRFPSSLSRRTASTLRATR